jgi:SseB protein N-terminal domain
MRTIPDPGFADDVGDADPGLAAALAVFDRSPGDLEAHRAVLAGLRQARLLVPVVALAGEMDGDHEKTSDMAAVLMKGQDGRTALLAFTSNSALRAWAQSFEGGDARPVPVTAQHAAQAAIQDQAEALLIDVAGPVLFVVEGADLRALAT